MTSSFKRSLIVKRSISIGGHKTSVSLESDYWQALRAIAGPRKISKLVQKIDAERDHDNLSSALRLYVLHHYIDR